MRSQSLGRRPQLGYRLLRITSLSTMIHSFLEGGISVSNMLQIYILLFIQRSLQSLRRKLGYYVRERKLILLGSILRIQIRMIQPLILDLTMMMTMRLLEIGLLFLGLSLQLASLLSLSLRGPKIVMTSLFHLPNFVDLNFFVLRLYFLYFGKLLLWFSISCIRFYDEWLSSFDHTCLYGCFTQLHGNRPFIIYFAELLGEIISQLTNLSQENFPFITK